MEMKGKPQLVIHNITIFNVVRWVWVCAWATNNFAIYMLKH